VNNSFQSNSYHIYTSILDNQHIVHVRNIDYHIANQLIMNNHHLYIHENNDIFLQDRFHGDYNSYFDMKLFKKKKIMDLSYSIHFTLFTKFSLIAILTNTFPSYTRSSIITIGYFTLI
jgi:hypothetical protein